MKTDQSLIIGISLTGFYVAVQNNIIPNVFCVQPKNLIIVILTSQEPRQIYSSYSLNYPKCWCPTLLCPSVNCLEATFAYLFEPPKARDRIRA